MVMLIGVPKETAAGEKRVATVPEAVEKLIKLGFSVAIESGAGDAANCSDDAYHAAGAEVLPDAATLWSRAEGAPAQQHGSGGHARRRHARRFRVAGAEP